jgi:hypothetical protein
MKKSDVYSQKKYWYHLSCTLSRKTERMKPRENHEGFNRADHEPNYARICVSPSIEQCLVAIPYDAYDIFAVYRTKNKELAERPLDIFDAEITEEGWLTKPTNFELIGKIDLHSIKNKRGYRLPIKEEAATSGDIELSKQVFNWWQRRNVKKLVSQNS